MYIHVYTMVFMFIYSLIEAFENAKLKYALVGGYAMALQGVVRATVDIDLVLTLSLNDFILAEQTLLTLGLQSRLPVRAQDIFKMRQEYIQNRNLIAWSFVDPKNPINQVDIIITEDLKNFETDRISVSGKKIVVASIKELIRMKSLANREQDIIDIQMLRKKQEALRGKK